MWTASEDLGKLEPRRVDHHHERAGPPHQAARFEARSTVPKAAATERVTVKYKKVGWGKLGAELLGQRLELKGLQ